MSRDCNNGFDEWGGYMEAKITKLEEQFAASSDPFRKSNLFAGISIFVNGLTNPSADELKRIMMVHGGTYHHYERSHTTYIIASNLPDVKVRNMNTSKIILPQWIVDCLKENRILDYTNYLLYTNRKKSQPILSFARKIKETPSSTDTEVTAILHELEELNEKIQNDLVNGQQHEQKKAETKVSAPPIGIPAVTQNQLLNQSSTYSSSTASVARTAVDPKFLSEFYNNSRLHHIATLGAGFKQYVSDLREKHSGEFPARDKIRTQLMLATSCGGSANKFTTGTWVMHIDMDCFFVSVGLRTYPHLRGLPIAVTHSKKGSAEVPVHPGADRKVEMDLFVKRFENHLHNNILSDKVRNAFDSKMSLSEIASCSYEARSKGIRNGMFVGQAMKLCPELKTIPYDFEGYKEVAFTLYNTVAQYTLNIEAVSCDEMFVDLTDVLGHLQVSPMDFVRHIREEVRAKTSCPCSAGVGSNKLQARMATKRAKPDGQYHLDPGKVEEYMAEIPIAELPGVGSSTSYTLRKQNLNTCRDLQGVSLAKIQMSVGKKLGETLHQFCRGIDNRPLVYGQIRKSVSAEVNYGIRFTEFAELEKFIRQLCAEVHNRLMDIKRKTKCITLKLMVRAKEAPVEASKFMGHGVCDHLTKSVSLSEFTCDLDAITRTILTTAKALDVPPKEMRGIGIQLSKLDDPTEGKEKKENVIRDMFSRVSERPQKEKKPVEKDLKSSSPTRKLQQQQKKTNGRTKVTSASTSMAAAPKKRPNVMGMLQSAAANKHTAAPTVFAVPDDIDPAFLAELPDDIREEILRDRAAMSLACKRSPQKEQPKLDACRTRIDNRSPPESRQEVQFQIVELPTPATIANPAICPENIFVQPECIQLLLSWVKSASTPESYDVDLISEHAKQLVGTQKIGDLYDPLVFLCRIINRQRSIDCSWHNAYTIITDAVQCVMRKTYEGRTLFLAEKINCDKCVR